MASCDDSSLKRENAHLLQSRIKLIDFAPGTASARFTMVTHTIDRTFSIAWVRIHRTSKWKPANDALQLNQHTIHTRAVDTVIAPGLTSPHCSSVKLLPYRPGWQSLI